MGGVGPTVENRQLVALQSRYDFWAKKRDAAMGNDDMEAFQTAIDAIDRLQGEAAEKGAQLMETVTTQTPVENPHADQNEVEAAPSKPARVPKSVKEKEAVAEKARRLAADKAAGKVAGSAGSTKTPKPPKEKRAPVLQPCLDGCGELVTKAFKMGHDAKLKSLILKIERGEEDRSRIPEIAAGLVAFKKGDVVEERDKEGKLLAKTQTLVCTKAPVRFQGRPEIQFTQREVGKQGQAA